MNRVLSFLLILPLICTQAWAIRGGPYDGLQWRGLFAIAGTYGVAMRGMRQDDITKQWSTGTTAKQLDPNDASTTVYSDPNPGTDDIVSTTAVLYLTVPATGICSGQILLFHKGLMYFGSATGMIERREMKITLLSELSHYSVYSGATYTYRQALEVNTGSAGIQATGLGITAAPRAILDFMLAGQIDLDISMDYFTGLVNLDGFANYVEVGSNEDTGNLGASRRSVLRDLVKLTENSNTGQLTVDQPKVEDVVPWPGGASAENEKVTAPYGIKLKATGARQSTDVTPQQAFVTPSAGTSWQIGAPVAGGS